VLPVCTASRSIGRICDEVRVVLWNGVGFQTHRMCAKHKMQEVFIDIQNFLEEITCKIDHVRLIDI